MGKSEKKEENEKKKMAPVVFNTFIAIFIMAVIFAFVAPHVPAFIGYVGGIVMSFTLPYGLVMVFVKKSNDAGDTKGTYKDFTDYKMEKLKSNLS